MFVNVTQLYHDGLANLDKSSYKNSFIQEKGPN